MPEELDISNMLRDSAAVFLGREHSIRRLRALRQRGDCLDPAIWQKMADQGWLGLVLDEARGGAGLDADQAALLSELFGRALLPEPFIAAAVMPAALISKLPSNPALNVLASGIANGELLVSVAWQEKAEGLDVRPDGVVIEPHRDGYLLKGRKVRVPVYNGLKRLLVTASLNGTPALVVVDAGASGVDINTEELLDGTAMAVTDFQSVSISGEDIVAQGAMVEAALARMVDSALLALGARLYGISATAVSLAVDYMETRSQFGQLLSGFQTLRHRAVDLTIENELARAVLVAAYKAKDEEDPTWRRASSAIAKARAADAAVRSTRAAIQIFGAIGYTDEVDIGLYLKAAASDASWLGASHGHRHTLATCLEEMK